MQSYAARLEEQLRKQAEDLRATTEILRAIMSISEAISTRTDLPTLVQTLASAVSPVLGMGGAAILLLDGKRLYGAVCPVGEPPADIELPVDSDTAAAQALYEPASPGNCRVRIHADHSGPLARAIRCRSLAVSDLRLAEHTIGVVAMAVDLAARPLDLHRLSQIQAVATQVALAIRVHQSHTELRVAYEELQAAQEQMVETAKLGAVGALAASIAHNIRNIVTPLQMELASASSSPAPEAARTQMDRLSALTHHLLALYRPAKIHPGPVEIKEVLNKLLALVQTQAEVDGITLRTCFAEKLPLVHGDVGRLEHLFITLLLNALESMAASGGTLTVSAEMEGHGVRVDVQDTGTGIAPEILPRLFDPFFTTRANGFGLGLFSAKRIAEEHHGRISVKSEEGQGACFSVWLPISRV